MLTATRHRCGDRQDLQTIHSGTSLGVEPYPFNAAYLADCLLERGAASQAAAELDVVRDHAIRDSIGTAQWLEARARAALVLGQRRPSDRAPPHPRSNPDRALSARARR